MGSYKANAWGLYDMHGNVWQWCNDWHDEDYFKKSPGRDPQGPEKGPFGERSGAVGRGTILAAYCAPPTAAGSS